MVDCAFGGFSELVVTPVDFAAVFGGEGVACEERRTSLLAFKEGAAPPLCDFAKGFGVADAVGVRSLAIDGRDLRFDDAGVGALLACAVSGREAVDL